MLQIVSPANKFLYGKMLQDMYRLRYRIFVERWGWDLKIDQPGLDIDQFDNERTIYLIRTNEDQVVTAACRLNPTTHPHLLSEIFPETCNVRGVPTGELIYECSRMVIDEVNLDRRDLILARREMSYGIVVYCQRMGIEQISWLCHLEAYNYCIRIWPSKPLGLMVDYGDDQYGAAISEMNDQALQESVRRLRGRIPSVHNIGSEKLQPELLYQTADEASEIRLH